MEMWKRGTCLRVLRPDISAFLTRGRQISDEFLWVENSIESWNCLHVSKSSIEPGTNCETIEESEKRKEGSWRSKIREKSFTFPVLTYIFCRVLFSSNHKTGMQCHARLKRNLIKKFFGAQDKKAHSGRGASSLPNVPVCSFERSVIYLNFINTWWSSSSPPPPYTERFLTRQGWKEMLSKTVDEDATLCSSLSVTKQV